MYTAEPSRWNHFNCCRMKDLTFTCSPQVGSQLPKFNFEFTVLGAELHKHLGRIHPITVIV